MVRQVARRRQLQGIQPLMRRQIGPMPIRGCRQEQRPLPAGGSEQSLRGEPPGFGPLQMLLVWQVGAGRREG